MNVLDDAKAIDPRFPRAQPGGGPAYVEHLGTQANLAILFLNIPKLIFKKTPHQTF